MFEKQTKSFLNYFLIAHLFVEENGSDIDNLGGDCGN